MISKDKFIIYLDFIITASLCFIIFCLPFAKAGVESFVWFAIALWIIKRVLGYRASSFWGMIPETGLNKALTALVVVNLLSVIFSVDYGLSLRGFFGKELKFLAIYFMLVEVINSRNRLRIVLITFAASAVLIVADVGVQYFKGIDFLRNYPLELFRGPFISHNGLGGWLIVVMFLFLGLLVGGRIKSKGLKASLLILVVLLFICLLGTYSRGAWLGFVGGFLLLFYYCNCISSVTLNNRLLCLFIAVCSLAIVLILPQSIKIKIKSIGRVSFKATETIGARIKSTFKTEEGSIPIRLSLWKEALRIVGKYPLVGCGLNTYSIVARNYKSFGLGGIYPHNSYLQKAAEIGLLGLLVFCWVLFSFFRIGLRYFRNKRDFLILGILSGILAFLVQSFFDTHLYSLQLVVLFWYMLGLTMVVIKLGQMEVI